MAKGNYQTALGSSGLLAALLQPTQNFAARSAARDQAVQLGAYQSALDQQEAQQTQAADAEKEAYLAKLRAQPFLGKDVAKLAAHVKGEEQQLYKELQSPAYSGDIKKFMATRGAGWMNESAERLRNSPFYQQALQNVDNVTQANEARKKGEFLAGNGDIKNYQTGEQRLQDFLSGKSDSFVHAGSYKPEDDLKSLRDQYAPGSLPWVPTPISEDTKLNSLVDNYGQNIGVDKYLRQHRGTRILYRTDPITKMYDFQRDNQRLTMEQQRLGLSIADHNQMSGLRAQQAELNRLNIAKKKNELSGTTENGVPFALDFLSRPSEVLRLQHDPMAPKKLPHSGIDVGQIPALSGVTMFDQSDQALARQLGLQKTKEGYSRGNIKEGFSTANGVHGFDLSGSNFSVVSYNPKLYYNTQQFKGDKTTKLDGFAQVTVKFSTPQDAERAGLYDPNRVWGGTSPTSIFDSTTKAGTGVYDPATQTATFFTPTGALGKGFFHSVQKSQQGVKAANEDSDQPYTNTGVY